MAILLIAILVRAHLRTLLSSNVRRVKAGPFEVEWDSHISEAEAELGHPELPPPTVEGGTLTEELTPVAAASPSVAVMEAFARIEHALRDTLAEAGAGRRRAAVRRSL